MGTEGAPLHSTPRGEAPEASGGNLEALHGGRGRGDNEPHGRNVAGPEFDHQR